MSGSPADAVSRAIERSKQLLFPFNFNKWCALGFTVFLAQCGEGSGSSFQMPSFPSGTGTGSGSSSPGSGAFASELESMLHTLQDNLTLVVALGAVTLVLGIGLGVLIAWFSSRAKLMFVESVIWDRLNIGEQWTRAAELGASLFKFRLVFGAIGWLLMMSALVAAIAVGWTAYRAGDFFTPVAVAGYLVLGGFALLVGFPMAVVALLLDDFVVPLMVVRNLRVREAWGVCRREVLANNVGGVVLFYLLRFVMAIVIGIVMVTLTCLTCCVAGLPYVEKVFFLPVYVFSRAYPLYYMEQLGLSIFPAPEPAWAANERWRFPT